MPKAALYQKKLIELQESYRRHSGPGRGYYLEKVRRQIREAYQKLEARYRSELNRFAPEALRARNKGSALSNAARGIRLAERSASPAKADPRLNVAVDGAFRVGKVKATYDAGGNWLKESSRQMVGFGVGGAAGIAAGKAAVMGETALAASMGLMAAGPVGLAVVGVIIVTGALVGLGVGYYFDHMG
ncbi:hypothetical protein ACMDCT_09750 [Halomonadaceae bacterium KBTZ08]